MADQIFLFYGGEELLIRERINQQKEAIANASLNVEQISAEKFDLERIVSALQTQTLLFGAKLVIIKDADLKLKDWEAVLPALRSLSANTTVIFWASAVDRRARIYKLIDDLGEVCEFKAFAAWEQDQVAAWIRRRTKAGGKEIDNSAALALLEVCGSSLMKLSSEIDKLVTYLGQRARITAADISVLSSPGRISVFALADAVAAKNLARSLAALRVLWQNRVELFPILAMLANRFRIMLLGKTVKDPQRIAQTLRANPYYIKKCLSSEALFSPAELERNLALLLETDLKLKSGEQRLPAFELLLTALCGQ